MPCSVPAWRGHVPSRPIFFSSPVLHPKPVWNHALHLATQTTGGETICDNHLLWMSQCDSSVSGIHALVIRRTSSSTGGGVMEDISSNGSARRVFIGCSDDIPHTKTPLPAMFKNRPTSILSAAGP